MSRIGIIGDTHLDVSRPGYLQFCADTLLETYDCDTIVHIGDLVDWHGISFHVRQPECPGVRDEYELAKATVAEWKYNFPEVLWCIGNHDERPARLAQTVAMPEFMIKPYKDLWDVPEWEVDFEFEIDGILFRHGTGCGGIHPAWNLMHKVMKSVVIGHCHSRGGVKSSCNNGKRFFAMDVGCGINEREYQFAYGKHIPERPFLSCGVVIDGHAIHIPMPCGGGEKYHDSNFVDHNAKPLVFVPKTATMKRINAQIQMGISAKDTADLMNKILPKKSGLVQGGAVHYKDFVASVTCGQVKAVCGTKGITNHNATSNPDSVTCGNCLKNSAMPGYKKPKRRKR